MSHRTHVQLIEKVDLPTQVWLTFWDLEERVQLSMEIGSPTNNYVVGEVFTLDRDAQFENLALQRSDDMIDPAKLLVPLPVHLMAHKKTGRGRKFTVNVVKRVYLRNRRAGTVDNTESSKIRAGKQSIARGSSSLLMIE